MNGIYLITLVGLAAYTVGFSIVTYLAIEAADEEIKALRKALNDHISRETDDGK